MKITLIFDIITIGLLLAINLILNNLQDGKNCIYLSDNGSISGVGKVDLFNRKQGNWIFLNPSNGKIRVSGEYHNDKKNGGWFRFYEDEICKIELFYKFSEDSIDGAVKWLSKSGEVDRTLYYKNGKFLFDRRDLRYDIRDGELDLLTALYDEEYLNCFDDNWNHKKAENNLKITYSYCADPYNFYYYDQSFYILVSEYVDVDLVPEKDHKIYINNWSNLIKIINYSFFVILLVVNILGLKNEKK